MRRRIRTARSRSRRRARHDRPDRPFPPRSDRGESLLEIVITVVVVAITVTALVSGLASVANAANSHRLGVQTDTTLRNAAEAVKSAARQCTPGARLAPVVEAPAGFDVSLDLAARDCPPVAASRRVTITVTGPDGASRTLTVVVRTP